MEEQIADLCQLAILLGRQCWVLWMGPCSFSNISAFNMWAESVPRCCRKSSVLGLTSSKHLYTLSKFMNSMLRYRGTYICKHSLHYIRRAAEVCVVWTAGSGKPSAHRALQLQAHQLVDLTGKL